LDDKFCVEIRTNSNRRQSKRAKPAQSLQGMIE
jgi:hypothetical protein